MGATQIRTMADGIGQFMGEVARRKVGRSALTYGATVFVLLQLAEIILPVFAAPDRVIRVLVVASILGFPLVLTLAWVFDLTALGLRRTEPEAGEEAQGVSGRTAALLPRLALLAVMLATVGGAGWWTVRKGVAEAGDPAVQVGPGDSAMAAASEEEPPAVGSLAVLPLEDFSEEGDGSLFAAGFHEELIARLSAIAEARVVSRTSVVSFDRTGKTMPTVAGELGVDGVVEGSVLRDGDRVRITVQLIHGPSDRHLWADSYEGTLEDALAFQLEAAEAVAKAIARHVAGSGAKGHRGRVAMDACSRLRPGEDAPPRVA